MNSQALKDRVNQVVDLRILIGEKRLVFKNARIIYSDIDNTDFIDAMTGAYCSYPNKYYESVTPITARGVQQ